MKATEDAKRFRDDDGDEEAELNKAALIADALAALVAGETEFERFAEDLTFADDDPPYTRSFADAGVLTLDDGFTFELPGGETVYVTVQVQ